VNGGFYGENALLDGVDKIRHIPAVIVQGRYDVVCPMVSAWELHRAWPESELKIVADAGHSALGCYLQTISHLAEPGITHELVSATIKYADL
jgi:proline iminopeptidase